MANTLLSLSVQFDAQPIKAMLEMVTKGIDGAAVAPPPARLFVLSECVRVGSAVTVASAPSPELLRWLADIVEANPNFK